MPRLGTVSTLVALAAFARLAAAQTALEVSTDQQTLAAVIPGECSTQCADWLATLGTCGTATAAVDAAYATCVCDDTFVSNFQTCAACMATDLTATNDAANAEIATNAPGELTAYCAAAGTAVSATSATDTTSSTLTTDTDTSTTSVGTGSTISLSTPDPTTTLSYSVPIPEVTTPTITYSNPNAVSTTSLPSDASVSGPTAGDDGIVTLRLTAAGQDFPTQSKSANAFVSGAAGAREGAKSTVVAAVVALAAVAGGMMLV
ncbi:hypothetical protein Rhopal_003955-T1 [Rhodotorula paludigena]|uniref:Proteophosphoglycan ppg4 n=1 Tax=Rhodotorula paludigena TaxID=86838 RepID=A0AAV5GN24_9BASI|nr:hypothetical protein Rhopal_003955-T1 [Rhodotorula paludigena]